MNARKLIWVVLGVTGVLQAMLIASGYNALLQDKSINLGPNGPMEIQFHGNLYPAIAWLVIVSIGAVIAVSAAMRFYEALVVVALGVFFTGALFQADLPYDQNTLWSWGAGAALVAIGLVFFYERLGLYRKKTVPSDAALLEHERASVHHPFD